MSNFSENLKKYRKRKNISQQKLGEGLNYGSTAIANYESGRNEPSFDCLIKLAEMLDVTVDELLGVELKTEERHLLSVFKKLDSEKKKTVLHLMDTLQT
ncbi:MAG: helix-turn-helix transcriptional regulator [Anaerotignum sp.]|nr:helix-turn-helix transcriptional regulator [Anaerotignum sp.]